MSLLINPFEDCSLNTRMYSQVNILIYAYDRLNETLTVKNHLKEYLLV